MNWLKALLKRDGDLMPLSRLSEMTGIKHMTLYMAVRMGRLEAVWDGHIWLSSESAVQEAQAAGRLMEGKE